MGDDSQEKTEEPTEKKLRDAREEGQVVKSKELSSFCLLISLFAYFAFQRASIVASIYEIYDMIFKRIGQKTLSTQEALLFGGVAKFVLIAAFKILIIPVVIAASVSGFVTMIQVGGIVLSPKAMEIKFDKFDMVANAKNMFSMQNMKKFVKDIIQLVVITIAGFYLIKANIPNILNSGYHDFRVISQVFFRVIGELFLFLLLIYMIFAIIDYIIEKVSFMKKMMMSLEEIKKEMKDSEVNAQVKQKQREIHQEMMEEESMDNTVKGSTLVVTNPTHLAIVILYDPEKVKLPVVVIKAKNHSVHIVKKLAQKHNVLVVRDVWLARQLYNLAELKKYIPSTLVAPVADIIGKYMHQLPQALQDAFRRQMEGVPNPVEQAKQLEALEKETIGTPLPPPLPKFRPSPLIRKPGD
jgi:type III secretion protein U